LRLEHCRSCCAVHKRLDHDPMTEINAQAMWPIESTIYYLDKTLYLPRHPNLLMSLQFFALLYYPLHVDEQMNSAPI
jgi:hypothetical protein